MSLAKLSALTGIDKSHLSKVQNGKAGLSDKNIRLVADALGVPTEKITHPQGEAVTAPRATKARKRPAPKIRENLPAPQTPEGQLFHYTPYEAAPWTPFSGRTLADILAAKKTDYIFNGRDNYITGAQIVALVEAHTVRTFSKSAKSVA